MSINFDIFWAVRKTQDKKIMEFIQIRDKTMEVIYANT